LTQEDYDAVQNRQSEGNKSTRLLLATAREAGFRNPVGLLTVCPVITMTESDMYPDSLAPPQRPDIGQSFIEGYLSLLPASERSLGPEPADGALPIHPLPLET